MSRAIKCDKCGTLSEESGHQDRNLEWPGHDWVRALRQVRVHIRLSPVNYGDDPYGGMDICRACFDGLIRKIGESVPAEPSR